MSRPSYFFEKLVKSLILQNASYWWVIFLVYHKILYDLNKITVTIRSTFWDCIFEWSFCVFLEKNLCMIHYYISSRRLALFYFSKWNSNLFSVINESDLWFVVESKTAYVTISQMKQETTPVAQVSMNADLTYSRHWTWNSLYRFEWFLQKWADII